MKHFWSSVVNCLSGFLIKKGYQNSRNRHEKYLNEKFVEYEEKNSNFVNKSYIELRNIGRGSGGIVDLIYHIPKEEIFALKIPFYESQHLIERERSNYLNIRHPFIVQYIGYIKFANDLKYLLLEYVEGETLDKYDLSHLNDQEKYTIILELLLSIHYLHSHNYIYRDLRLNKIMINQNKDAILINFDHVLKVYNEKDDEEQTINFASPSVAPEENKTYKSDIYSLGYIIHFILYGIPPIINYKLSVQGNFKFKSCFETDPTKRPNINEMTSIFYTNLYSKIKFGDKKFSYLISLSSNQNIPEAQFDLGNIFYEGLDARQDINKAIHYFSLAANQNIPQAQYILGFIYYEGKFVARDINKAIHYYSLAANQNIPKSQFYLGVIYSNGKYVTRDINKAIHYYSLVSNQNNPQAQFNLSAIYYEGKYVTRDINKAIYYFTLAANFNYPNAQYILGSFYLHGEYVTRDINKAIRYYSLAANQNLSQAQFILGVIYYVGDKIKQDIKKGRYYIMLSSMNDHRQANFAHGFLLHEGKCVEKDIAGAIHYYKEASSFNNQYSKNNLGIIYKHGYREIKGNVGNAIVYFEEAIRQKNDYLSMYNLARIYMYDSTIKQDLNKSIDLLIRSMNKFKHSSILLSLALLLKFDFNIETIQHELKQRTDITRSSMEILFRIITLSKSVFDVQYESYRYKDYLYNVVLEPIESSELEQHRIFIKGNNPVIPCYSISHNNGCKIGTVFPGELNLDDKFDL
ncbi:hypothetical protein M9Y10_019570 [Tritrichomonas musculus]|uniref:Protein kinase domain-containing protein n=1 Tax=Tritrichomonas musculus TaxID=1915356 RepID=A0ABR2HHL4_9EUKA